MRQVIGIAVSVVIAAGAAVTWLVARERVSDRDTAPRALTESYRVDDRAPAVRALELEAVRGSGNAAVRLVYLYGHCHKSEPTPADFKRCGEAIKYWTAVAVEYGSDTGIKYHIDDLL